MFIKSVRLENFVTFKDAFVPLDKKLNIFFGESGSGKSLFLEAILGAFTKLKKEFVGVYGDFARVCLELEYDGLNHQIVHVVDKKGKTQIFSDLLDLEKISKKLVYCGQGAYAELLDHREQLSCLDSFIQQYEPLELPRLKDLISKKNSISQELRTAKTKLDNFLQVRDFIKSKKLLIEVISEYGLISQDSIEQQLKLRKVAAWAEALDQMRDDLSRLKVALTSFLKNTALDDQEGLQILISLENWMENLSKSFHATACHLSEDLLWEIKFFFDDLKKLYPNFDLSKVLSFEEELNYEIAELESLVGGLEKDLRSLEEKLMSLAAEISKKRKAYFPNFVRELSGMLSELNFSHVELEGKFSPTKLTEMGVDSFELFASFNKGFQVRPLRKIASGGEFARFLVASLITSRLHHSNQILLLDEPDTGLSGKSLKKLVEMIEKLSESCQVLLVSHQYREYEGQKFFVEKIEVAGKSVSVVKDVDKTSYL